MEVPAIFNIPRRSDGSIYVDLFRFQGLVDDDSATVGIDSRILHHTFGYIPNDLLAIPVNIVESNICLVRIRGSLRFNVDCFMFRVFYAFTILQDFTTGT